MSKIFTKLTTWSERARCYRVTHPKSGGTALYYKCLITGKKNKTDIGGISCGQCLYRKNWPINTTRLKINMNSQQYLDHCVSVFENDKSLSAETFIIMMREYAERIIQERLSDIPQNEQPTELVFKWNNFNPNDWKTHPPFHGIYYVKLLPFSSDTLLPILAQYDTVLKKWHLLKSPNIDSTGLVISWGIKLHKSQLR